MRLGLGIQFSQVIGLLAAVLGITWANNLAGSTDTNQVVPLIDTPSGVTTIPNNALAFGSGPAGSGTLRFPATGAAIKRRNAANSGDLGVLTLDASDGLTLGDANTGIVTVQGSRVSLKAGATEMAWADGSGFSVGGALLFGTTPATSGTIRLGAASSIRVRNTADSGNINIASVNASDVITFGGVLNSGLVFGTATAGNLSFQVNAVERAKLDTNGLTVTAFTTGRVVTVSTGGLLVDTAGLTDAFIASGAAIAGSKIAPDFGAQNIVTTGYASFGATTATGTAGLNFPTSTNFVTHRNFANSGNITVLSAGGSTNDLSVGNATSTTTLNLQASSVINMRIASVNVAFGNNSITFPVGAGNPTIGQVARTTDAATNAMSLAGQAPYASATGTNRNSGDSMLVVAAPASGGTAGSAKLRVNATDVLSASHNGTTGTIAITVATTMTAPAAGAGGALPATPAGYYTKTINGTARQVPFY